MQYYNFVTSGLLSVTGKDARRYLNARLTSNVKDSKSNQVQLAAQLNAQGKCQGTFSLINLDDSKFILVSAFASLDLILSNFRQFIVADRVDTLDITTEYKFVHIALDESQNSKLIEILELTEIPKDNITQIGRSGIIAWAHARGIKLGIDVLIPAQLVPTIQKFFSESNAQSLSDDQMLIGRARSNNPVYPLEMDNNIFSEGNVSNYFSFTKGCYVGQEVIERIDAMGKTAWKVTPFSAGEIVAPKSAINDNLGSIINCSTDKMDGAHWGFARVRNIPNDPHKTLQVQGIQIFIKDS